MPSDPVPSSERDLSPGGASLTRFAVFDECPLCGVALSPEHAHFRCSACGWRDSCCD